MAEFSWDEVHQRRRAFADEVGQRLGLSFGLGAGVRESFGSIGLNPELLADQPMWRVPFLVVANRMNQEQRRLIDHAWWLIADDRGGEPWGFVTEPYVKQDEAVSVAETISREVEPWGVTVEAWSSKKSPWYPGSTVPIVTIAGVGRLTDFLRLGVQAALDGLGGK